MAVAAISACEEVNVVERQRLCDGHSTNPLSRPAMAPNEKEAKP